MPTTLQGTKNADVLVGGTGSEVLLGLAGNDQLFGGQGGDDVFDGGAGADLIDGGIGFDTLVFWSATAGVAMSLITGGTGGDAAGDVYVSIEISTALHSTITSKETISSTRFWAGAATM